jgi:hypothetical protein
MTSSGGEDVDVGAVRLDRFLDVGDRVARELPHALGALHHAVENGEDLELRAVVHPPADGEAGGPALDSLGRDVLESHLSEGGKEVGVEDRVVVAHRGRFAGAVVLDPAQVLGRRVGEGGAGADHAGQRAAARLVEQVAQPRLGGALREVAGRRATARRPRRPDALLDLAAVREPVLRVPDVAALRRAPVHVACRNPDHGPIMGSVGTFLGPIWGPNGDQVR